MAEKTNEAPRTKKAGPSGSRGKGIKISSKERVKKRASNDQVPPSTLTSKKGLI